MLITIETWQQHILTWHAQYGRHDLPWQNPATPYRVWISEIMLQQTQVATVIPYYQRFMQQFPTVNTLATASLDDVLALWSGLGYYARARYLHQSAQRIVAQHDSQLPQSLAELVYLPGIGRSTAGAILSLAYMQSAAILDGNVKRILSRVFAIDGLPQKAATQKKLWALAEQYKPIQNCNHYNQALMDLGATRCHRIRPVCTECPLQSCCIAYINNRIAQYPNKTPSKKKPVRYFIWHVYEQSSGFFLQQRPLSGLWAGLWCFPQQEVSTLAPYRHLATIRHQFTHFTGHFYIKRHRKTADISSLKGEWIATDALHQLAMPRPINQFFEQLWADKKRQSHCDSI